MNATSHLLRGLLERGWTQSEIARRTGIPQPRLSKWAGGKVPSGAEDALKLKALSDSGTLPSKAPVAACLGGQGGGEGDVHGATLDAPCPNAIGSQTAGETV